MTPERTPDGRYIVVDGRRWRAHDPDLSEDDLTRLRSHLGRARSAVGRARDEVTKRAARDRVQLAKEGLGERGDAWWDLDLSARRDRAADRLTRLDQLVR